MDQATRSRLEASGWRTGSVQDFLKLTEAEAAFIEAKLALAAELRAIRHARDLSQTQVARRVGSSQSRVAKMEAADASVSLDLIVRALLALGVDRREVAAAMARPLDEATR